MLAISKSLRKSSSASSSPSLLASGWSVVLGRPQVHLSTSSVSSLSARAPSLHSPQLPSLLTITPAASPRPTHSTSRRPMRSTWPTYPARIDLDGVQGPAAPPASSITGAPASQPTRSQPPPSAPANRCASRGSEGPSRACMTMPSTSWWSRLLKGYCRKSPMHARSPPAAMIASTAGSPPTWSAMAISCTALSLVAPSGGSRRP
mmetsp:Transcript_9982/g.32352  ORF Transcript_9982/g.32352 Transcript_9982/m.32352 type:complete len:205 (+) Transcript_9982:630-1244(+)